jgi:hypothetical protein
MMKMEDIPAYVMNERIRLEYWYDGKTILVDFIDESGFVPNKGDELRINRVVYIIFYRLYILDEDQKRILFRLQKVELGE